MSEAKEKLSAAIAAAGLTMLARFIPFSVSRNSKEKNPSLNWIVTLQRNGRDVLTTDYMAGCGHCPAYKNAAIKKSCGSYLHHEAIRHECETGETVLRAMYQGSPTFMVDRKKPILPDTCDVVYSLILDASALDSSSFEDWCADYGYSDDSIKARQTFDACLAHGMKLRAAIGNDTFATLQELCNDY